MVWNLNDEFNNFSLLDEAEVYFAYGRIEQGLEIVNEVLRKEPSNEKALEYKAKYSNFSTDESAIKYQAPVGCLPATNLAMESILSEIVQSLQYW